MAGDWIKMRSDLRDDPAVFQIASLTKLDRFNVVGRLAAFWGWIDKHAVDGRVDGASVSVVDDIVSFDGFAAALQAVGWLRVDSKSVYIPNHDRHNIESGKERSLKNVRQAKWRAKKASESWQKVDDSVDADVDASSSTKTSTREEKRREDINTPKAPKGAVEVPDWIPEKPWADFVAMRRAKGAKTPFTVAAAKGVIEKLEKFRAAGHDIAAVLSESVINGWSGVFEPKDRQQRLAGGRDDWTAGAT